MADIVEGFVDRGVEFAFGYILYALSNPIKAAQILTRAGGAVSPLGCLPDDL